MLMSKKYECGIFLVECNAVRFTEFLQEASAKKFLFATKTITENHN